MRRPGVRRRAAAMVAAALLAGCGRGPGVGGRAYCDALDRVVGRSGALVRADQVPDAAATRRLAAAVGAVAHAAPSDVAPAAAAWQISLEQTAVAMEGLETARRQGRAAVSAMAVAFGAAVDLTALADSARQACGVELPFAQPAAGVEPPAAIAPADETDPTLPATTVPPAGTPTLSVRVAYVGFASGAGGGLIPGGIDVRVGSDPAHLPAPVISGVPGPYVTDPIVLAVGDVGYDIGPSDPQSDMLRYQGSTSGLAEGTQLVVATLRLPTGGDVTAVPADRVGLPAPGRARLGFVLLWPEGAGVRLRPGQPGEGCIGEATVTGGPFSDPVSVDVEPGRREVALYAGDDTACTGTPVIGGGLVGAADGTATLVVGWRADDVNKGFLPVPLTSG